MEDTNQSIEDTLYCYRKLTLYIHANRCMYMFWFGPLLNTNSRFIEVCANELQTIVHGPYDLLDISEERVLPKTGVIAFHLKVICFIKTDK